MEKEITAMIANKMPVIENPTTVLYPKIVIIKPINASTKKIIPEMKERKNRKVEAEASSNPILTNTELLAQRRTNKK